MSKNFPTPTATWQRAMLKYVTRHPDRPLKARALARELNIPNTDYTRFRALVRSLVDDGTLVLGPGRTLRLPEQSGQVIGVYRANPRGFGFVEQPGKPGIYIPAKFTGGAHDGDKVAVRVRARRGRGPGPRGEIIRVVERAPQRWIGILEQVGSNWTVQPLGRQPLPPMRVDNARQAHANPGDLVLIEPSSYTPTGDIARAEIIESLGDPEDARVQIRAAIRRFDIPDHFSGRVNAAAKRAAARFDGEQLDGRQDLRKLLTITIDPATARDFDDAITIEALGAGKMRLGVHIADVSYFVKPGGPLDEEARRRGNSVYFPGLAVPMLPEVLSNDVCCLRPHEPRYAKSVFVTYDRRGRVLDTSFCNSLIQSDARLTYEEATAALDSDAGEVSAKVLELLKDADKLARRIRRRRLEEGMLTLALPEVEFEIDADGRVTDAVPADTSFSHTIIEMFMVEANEAVSRHLSEAGLQHLRRIHPPPAGGDADELLQLAPVLGRRPELSVDRDNIRKLLSAVAGQPEERPVSYVLLRLLSQACYSPVNEGHFGLASDDYCHFTSPIRRYPDLTVHRLLDLTLTPKGKHQSTEGVVLPDPELIELGHHTSGTERRALQAERHTEGTLSRMLMKHHLGEVFDGIITSVVSFGVFVQLQPFMAEGLIRVGDMGSDEWIYRRKLGVFVGRGTSRVVYIGQPVRVMVAAVSELREELTLVPADGGPLGTTRGPIIEKIRSKTLRKRSNDFPRRTRGGRTGGRRPRRR